MKPIPPHRPRGFTLLELLVVISIVAVLAALLANALAAARVQGNQAKCAANLRQIGVAINLSAGDNGGYLPLTTHSTGSRRVDESWIYVLAPYLQEMDSVRVCPADPPARRQQILDRKATSYALNELLYDSEDFNKLERIPHPAQTLAAVILSENRVPSPTWDHVHSSQWSSWVTLLNDVEVDRHRPGARAKFAAQRTRGGANYLYADGHVEGIPAVAMKQRLDAGINPAEVPGSE
jgi:prepilin-type N-terminal cleavage/methylation domain-containing protein/prepilin-type processing-associated H-X9-DG protein